MPWSKYDSAGNPLGVAAFGAGVSTFGNTAGSTGMNNSQMVLVGSGGIVLSGSTNTAGATVTIVPGGVDMSRWGVNTAALYSSSTSNMALGSVSLLRFDIPAPVSFSRVDVPVQISLATSATTNTAAVNLSFVAQILTRNASTLNPILGQSSTTTYTWASNTGVIGSISGARMLSFALASRLTAGEYYFGLQISSSSGSSIGLSTTALSASISPVYGTMYSVLPWANMSSGTAVTENVLFPLQGVNSVSLTATNQTHQQSQITVTGTAVRANMMIILRNI